jgi:hypothetical protein
MEIASPSKTSVTIRKFHATWHPPKYRFFIKITVGAPNFVTLNLRYVTLCCRSLERILSEYTSSLNWLLWSSVPPPPTTVKFAALLCNLELFSVCDCQGYDVHRSAVSKGNTDTEVILYHWPFSYRYVYFIRSVPQDINIIPVNDGLDAQFLFLYVYVNSLRVSSNLVLIIRRINCINTTSGICHSVFVLIWTVVVLNCFVMCVCVCVCVCVYGWVL